MEAAPAVPARRDRRTSTVYDRVTGKVEETQESVREWLLPTGTLITSEFQSTGEIRQARCLVGFFYFALTGFFGYCLFFLFFSGRVEVFSTRYKLDRIEAPSMVICPFNPGDELALDPGHTPVTVVHYGIHGPKEIPVEPRECLFDRKCVCTSLFGAKGPEVYLVDYLHEDTKHIGQQGNFSMGELDFQDRVEFRTHLLDTSPERSLKFGFYDSQDETPAWVFAHVGSYAIGQLDLERWFVSDVSWRSLQEFFAGDFRALNRRRHIFRFYSQEVHHELGTPESGPRRDPQETRLSYEMQSFFVSETIASETALSLYTLMVILLFVAMRGPVVEIFFALVFPVPKPAVKEPARQLAPAVRSCLYVACCGCLSCWDVEENRETEPLLE